MIVECEQKAPSMAMSCDKIPAKDKVHLKNSANLSPRLSYQGYRYSSSNPFSE